MSHKGTIFGAALGQDVLDVEEAVYGATGMWIASSTAKRMRFRSSAGDVLSVGPCTRCARIRTGEGSGLRGL